MPRYRPPVVGLKGANQVRLSRRLKQRLRRRAQRQAAEETNPLIAALRAEKQMLKRQRSRDLAAAQQTIAAGVGAYNIPKSDLRDYGLKGRYLKDVAQEFDARGASIQSALPSVMAGVRSDYRQPILDTKLGILDAKTQRATTEAQLYGSMLSSAMTDAQAGNRRRIAARQDRRDQEKEPMDEGRANAIVAAKNALTSWRKNIPYPDDFEVEEYQGMTPQEVNPLKEGADLRAFAAAMVDQYEGVNLRDAMWALRRVLGGMTVGPPAPGRVRPGPFGG